MRVDQLLPYFSPNDAIGNHAVEIRSRLHKAGVDSDIFSPNGGEYEDSRRIEDLDKYNRIDNAVIFHFGMGTNTAAIYSEYKGKRILDYHNITPEWYFTEPEDFGCYQGCKEGRIQLPFMVDASDTLWCHSRYSANELRKNCGRDALVTPVFRNYSKLLKKGRSKDSLPDQIKESRYILFVGRITPNKCQHDLCTLLYLLKKHFHSDAKLYLVGTPQFGYWKNLMGWINELALTIKSVQKIDDLEELEDTDIVHFKGLSEGDLSTLYQNAFAFVSMSEHEGFGVPLVEAMRFGVPVFFQYGSAVDEVCGGGGIGFDKSKIGELALQLDEMFDSQQKQEELSALSLKWGGYFSERNIDESFETLLSNIDLKDI